jgi:diaminohydroxyphosphoribosylaminopyrimidine deaminase/5-amino-6-(5-phosphoribosylamino)uracil reductase
MDPDQTYMFRCLQLAAMGIGRVAPNPMVGAVLAHGDRVIGEGHHRVYGGPHAEVECLESVRPADRHLIPASRMYVSLEPCAHHGKTPPCADRIIREGIKEVHVACRDPFPDVDGKGIERMRAAGVKVEVGSMASEARELNRRFLTFHLARRPYIVLKWAESADGMIAGPGKVRTTISGPLANRIVHRWRSEEQAILIGSQTAAIDDPRLTARIPGGHDPLRIVIDRLLSLPAHLHIFTDGGQTVVVNIYRNDAEGSVRYLRIPHEGDPLAHTLSGLYGLGVQSVLVEGGRFTLDAFLKEGLWDECRRIRSLHLQIPDGYPAPQAPMDSLVESQVWDTDRIDLYRNQKAIPDFGEARQRVEGLSP